MRIVGLYLLCLCWSLVCSAFEMDQSQRQKRQLDWNGGGRIYHFDHLAMSSLVSSEHMASGEESSSSSSSEEDSQPDLSTASSKSGLPGDPGFDYPIFPSIPLTDFHCRGRTPGFYGDTQTACQVFHVCDVSGRQDSFLCPNGTIFSQKLFACDWWYNVQCAATREHYQLNRNLFKGGDVNLYGTPSFWNWLSESEEVHSNAPSPKEVGRAHQKVATRPGEYVRTRPSAPRGPPVQFQQSTEPNPRKLEIEQLPEAAPLVQSYPTEQFAEPVVDSAELEPIGPSRVQSARLLQWDSSVPAPQIAATLPSALSDVAIASHGFTRDYQNHFNWMNRALHSNYHADMSPELSWSDLGPNGPLMTDHHSQAADEQSIWQQAVPADRRRKAQPVVQRSQKPVVKKQTSTRQVVLTPPAHPPVYYSKAAPFKKDIVSSRKHVATRPQTKFFTKSVSKAATPKVSSSPKVTPTSTPKSNLNKIKPDERSTTVTETMNRPLAKIDHFNEDTVDYDDGWNEQKNQKISEATTKQAHRFGSRIRKAGKAHRTEYQETRHPTKKERKFVPSPKVMPIVPSPEILPSRSDASSTDPLTQVTPTSQPVSLYRTEPFWNYSSAQNRIHYQPIASPVPVSRAQQPNSAEYWPVTQPAWNAARRSLTASEIYRPAEARSLDESVPSGRSTVALERIPPVFRPSQPIPAITSNSHQPRVRTLRAHPSSKARSSGVKRKRKSKSRTNFAYDPRLDRPYGKNHPIWKLQNWESTKI